MRPSLTAFDSVVREATLSTKIVRRPVGQRNEAGAISEQYLPENVRS